MPSEIEKTRLLVKINQLVILPKEPLTASCCLSANMERMVAKRIGLGFPCSEQRGLEIPGLN